MIVSVICEKKFSMIVSIKVLVGIFFNVLNEMIDMEY